MVLSSHATYLTKVWRYAQTTTCLCIRKLLKNKCHSKDLGGFLHGLPESRGTLLKKTTFAKYSRNITVLMLYYGIRKLHVYIQS